MGGGLARSEAVMGDYHSALILEELKSGYGKQEIVERYVSGRAFDRLNVEGIWEASLDELRRRDEKNEISISRFIESATADGSIGEAFLSFNHPKEYLINYIAREFIHLIMGREVAGDFITAQTHNLYADARWPLHPVVAERLKLPPPTISTFKQPDRLGGAVMHPGEFVQRSVDFYLTDRDLTQFTVMTPSYLSRNISSAKLNEEA